MRRIITAREQYGMLAPWRQAAALKRPWSDFSANQAWPLQSLSTSDVVRMHDNLKRMVREGEDPRPGNGPHMERLKNHAAELLDRHEAGDPEATEWAEQNSYIPPHYYTDQTHPEYRPGNLQYWEEERQAYPEDYPTDPRPKRRRSFKQATPWHSEPGDPTYRVPTQDLQRYRQFNPSIETPEQMHRSVWTQPFEKEERPYRNFATPWSSGGSSEGSSEDDLVEAIEKGHKLPPVEITTNGVGAILSDGNHRVNVADMLSHPELESYIHYDPHKYQDDWFTHSVDHDSELGKHIHRLVQTHPYEPVEGGPTTDHVFRRHPQTGEWQRGKLDHSSAPHFVDTPEHMQQMKQHVPGFKNQGLGTYFDVDFGNGPEITHERHLHANLRTAANNWDIRHSAGRDSGVYSAHDPVTGEKAAHLMYRTYTDDDGTPTFLLNGIRTEPAYQRQGVMTSLLQRLHDDHPGHRVDPGPRSDQGDAWWQHLRANEPGFSDWTKNSPKSLRDNLRGVLGPPQPIGGGRLAMADTAPWHPLIDRSLGTTEGMGRHRFRPMTYDVRLPDSHPQAGTLVGRLEATKSPHEREVYVDSISSHPNWKGQGIAQALIERLVADHPDHHVNPGVTTSEGAGFTQRLLETAPDARSKLAPGWKLSPISEEGSKDYKQEIDNLWSGR